MYVNAVRQAHVTPQLAQNCMKSNKVFAESVCMYRDLEHSVETVTWVTRPNTHSLALLSPHNSSLKGIRSFTLSFHQQPNQSASQSHSMSSHSMEHPQTDFLQLPPIHSKSFLPWRLGWCGTLLGILVAVSCIFGMAPPTVVLKSEIKHRVGKLNVKIIFPLILLPLYCHLQNHRLSPSYYSMKVWWRIMIKKWEEGILSWAHSTSFLA